MNRVVQLIQKMIVLILKSQCKGHACHVVSNFQQVSTESMQFSKATKQMKKNEKVGKFVK